ncbi:hypothetical protein ACWDV7_20425 [Streptomyces sp. NPDC003362]
MLDPEGDGAAARFLNANEPVPLGSQPVLVADTTVYGAVCVEHMLRAWHQELPRPWLVWVADVPGPPPAAARYRIKALGGRLAGVSRVPYLPSLRVMESAEEALKHKDISSAARRLRRELEGT